MTRTVPLGPFELTRRIGVGGGGEVWAGVHVRQRVKVAVKVITADRARDERYQESFENEVRSVAGLDHPGVVTVFDYGRVDAEAEARSEGRMVAGSPYLAMELAERGSLRSALLPSDFEELRLSLLWLLDILAHAHAHGVIHRDLKPGNVLVFDEPSVRGDVDGASRLRLTDFGLAHPTDGADGVLKGTAGTPIFMAPEQFRGRWREFGPPTDLYALGCMAYTLAAGRPPFPASDIGALMHAHLTEPPPPLLARFPVPAGFPGWIGRLMHKRADRRFQRAADAAFALAGLSEAADGGPVIPFRRVLSLPPGSRAPTPQTGEPTASDLTDTRTVDDATSSHTHTTLGGELATDELELAPPTLPPDEDERGLCPRAVPPLPGTWRADLPQRPSMQLVGAGLGLYGLRSIPLVARNRERELLWRALTDVRAGKGPRAVILRGPSGTGKSRLAQWLGMLGDSVGSALVMRASHSPGGGPLDGLPRMIAALTRAVGLDRDGMAAWIGRWLRDRGVHEAREARAVLELLAPRGGDEQMLATASERHALIQRVVAAAVGAQSDVGPVRPAVIWLDDVQWGQDALGFVQWLLGQGASAGPPIVVVLTVQEEGLVDRPVEAERLAALEALPSVRAIPVPPLSRTDRSILVQELLHLEGELADQVEKRTQGNPLFAVQLVGDWVQRGVLEVGATGFVLRPGERAVIPDDIHELWADRVERALADRDRSVLELAALLGTDVDDTEWRGACRVAGLSVPPALVATLVSHGLARRGEPGWSFAHGMLRESLERSAREGGRLELLHRACATTLQIRLDANPQPGLQERLGRHLVLGDRAEEALGPLLAGAQERRAASDYLGALGVLDQRERQLDALDIPSTDARRGEGWVTRADVLICMGRLEEAERYANQVVEVGRRRTWEALMAPALRHAAIASGKRGLFAAAERRLKRAIEAAHYGGSEAEAARCTLFLGDVARLRGSWEEAAGHCRQALARFKGLDDARGQGEALHGLAGVYLGMGQLDQAERFCRAAAERFEAVGARFGVASSQNALGDVLRASGQLVAAEVEYTKAEAGLRALGSPEHHVCAINLSVVLIERGHLRVAREGPSDGRGPNEFTEARERLQHVLDAMKRARRAGLVGLCHVALLPCFADAREWRGLRAHLDHARRLLKETGVVDADAARCAEIAADRTAAHGAAELARDLGDLAASQWSELGRPSRAASLRRRFG